jgi:hypothetical protein
VNGASSTHDPPASSLSGGSCGIWPRFVLTGVARWFTVIPMNTCQHCDEQVEWNRRPDPCEATYPTFTHVATGRVSCYPTPAPTVLYTLIDTRPTA